METHVAAPCARGMVAGAGGLRARRCRRVSSCFSSAAIRRFTCRVERLSTGAHSEAPEYGGGQVGTVAEPESKKSEGGGKAGWGVDITPALGGRRSDGPSAAWVEELVERRRSARAASYGGGVSETLECGGGEG